MSDLRRLPVARRRNRAPRVGDSRATVPQSRRRCCTGDGNAERPQQLECERRRGAKEIDEDRVLLKRHPPSAIATRRPKGRSRDVASLRADALVRDRSRSVGDCACVSSLSSDSSHRAPAAGQRRPTHPRREEYRTRASRDAGSPPSTSRPALCRARTRRGSPGRDPPRELRQWCPLSFDVERTIATDEVRWGRFARGRRVILHPVQTQSWSAVVRAPLRHSSGSALPDEEASDMRPARY